MFVDDDCNEGFPTAERAIRGSTNIETLSDEDQELLRVACKVASHTFLFFTTQS